MDRAPAVAQSEAALECYNRHVDESNPPRDIWHREIAGTVWMRKLGAPLAAGFLLVVGCFDLMMEITGIRRGWFSDAAKWMGAGPWFQWVLAAQMMLAGLVALLSAQLYLRDRSKSAVQIGFYGGAFIGYLGPSHAPDPGSDVSHLWFRYALSLAALIGVAALSAVHVHKQMGRKSESKVA